MKKITAALLILVSLFFLFSCKKKDEEEEIDLTQLSSTLVYAQVSDMISNPQNYLGKTVKMRGKFRVQEASSRNYYACIIQDATACCSQGIEFVLSGKHKYPDDYPSAGDEITVVGKFDVYLENKTMYYQLINAKFV